MSEGTVDLYRPVGPRELARIAELDWRAFPTRLHWQPIFYPVLSEDYARQIARDWNATEEKTGYRGFVTRFKVNADYVRRFDIQVVGGRQHQELWVPAEELEEFNANIIGEIQVVAAYQGGEGRSDVVEGEGPDRQVDQRMAHRVPGGDFRTHGPIRGQGQLWGRLARARSMGVDRGSSLPTLPTGCPSSDRGVT